jgi:aminomethyltransferase
MADSAQGTSHLKKLPLHSEHERFGARFGTFGEWYVPLYYTSVIEEHETVRKGVGVFDISHMGEFYVRGKDARSIINHWITNDVAKLTPGRALYSPVCRDNGGIVDDVVVMEIGPEEYLIVVNAANIEKDFEWFSANMRGGCASGAKSYCETVLENESDETALLAVQGPKSKTVVSELFNIDLTKISYYHFMKFDSAFGPILLSETGYTGEEGYEIFSSIDQALPIWKRLMAVGEKVKLKPIGFGARDTLRLELRFLLYGHDMTDETTPLEAGLDWTVAWNKKDFIGKNALQDQRRQGISRKLIGFQIEGRGIAREGCVVCVEGRSVGEVTSGTYSPTIKKSIGLAYVASQYSKVGQTIDIEIRNQFHRAQIVKTPFYKRTKNQ